MLILAQYAASCQPSAGTFEDEWGVPRVQQPLAGDLTAVVLADVCTSVNEAFEPEQPLGRGLLMWAPAMQPVSANNLACSAAMHMCRADACWLVLLLCAVSSGQYLQDPAGQPTCGCRGDRSRHAGAARQAWPRPAPQAGGHHWQWQQQQQRRRRRSQQSVVSRVSWGPDTAEAVPNGGHALSGPGTWCAGHGRGCTACRGAGAAAQLQMFH